MRHAGFVLVGGRSSRMGRDKALLPWGGTTLAERAARIAAEAAGSAMLIGDPARYGALGYAVIPDRYSGCGPMGGVATALRAALADWNLIVACDMPALTVGLLRMLLENTGLVEGSPQAASRNPKAVIPMGPDGPEVLCAVYHSSSLAVFETAIAAGRLKMRDAIGELAPRLIHGIDAACFANLNMPEDLAAFSEQCQSRPPIT